MDTLDARPVLPLLHSVERIEVCVVADSDAVLGSVDKKNPTSLLLIGDVTSYPPVGYLQ